MGGQGPDAVLHLYMSVQTQCNVSLVFTAPPLQVKASLLLNTCVS